MSADVSLPQGFGKLEPFVDGWSIAGSQARSLRRAGSTKKEREDFYAAASSLLMPALEHLDAKGLDGMDAADERLMNLMLSLAHVSLAEEMQGSAEPQHAQFRAFLPITHSPAGA